MTKNSSEDCYGRCRPAEAIHSLQEAVLNRFGSLKPVHDVRVTLRVNQGSQDINRKLRERPEELGVKIEYCGINCPGNEPCIESFSPATSVKRSTTMTIVLLVMPYWGGCSMNTGIKQK